MSKTVFSSRDFNREPGRIKRAAINGPVIITQREEPSLVVMAFRHYQRLTGKHDNILDALAMPSLSDIRLDTTLPKSTPKAAEFE